MRPLDPIGNLSNSALAHAKFTRYLPLRSTIGKTLANYRNVYLAQFCRSIERPNAPTKNSAGMPSVFGMSNPFEVRRPIVALDSINVIGFMAAWTRTDKRLANRAMDKAHSMMPATARAEKQVAIGCHEGFKYASRPGVYATRRPPNATNAGNLVCALVADHWTPFLNRITLNVRHGLAPFSGLMFRAGGCFNIRSARSIYITFTRRIPMSEYASVRTAFRDKAALIAALHETVGPTRIQLFDKPAKVIGYRGKDYGLGEIILKKEDARGKLRYGDMGFVREKDGTFKVNMDDLDQRRMMRPLRQNYALEMIKRQATQRGQRVEFTRQTDGRIIGQIVGMH